MSSPQRIRRLGITAFRGAIRPMQIRFRADQPIALIYGENGTGKSTIADAIDFVCNNELGSVHLRSGTKPAHVVAATAAASDLRVELVVENHTWIRWGFAFIWRWPSRQAMLWWCWMTC